MTTKNNSNPNTHRGGHRERHVRIRGIHRDPPDLQKLGRALIALARAQLEAEAQAQAEAKAVLFGKPQTASPAPAPASAEASTPAANQDAEAPDDTSEAAPGDAA